MTPDESPVGGLVGQGLTIFDSIRESLASSVQSTELAEVASEGKAASSENGRSTSTQETGADVGG